MLLTDCVGLYEKNPFAEVKSNGVPNNGVDIKAEDAHIKAGIQQSKYEHKAITKLDARLSGNKSTLERQEERAKEEKAREEKAREERAKEEKAREEKAKEEKAREEKAREERARKPDILERGRSRTDEEVRRPDSRTDRPDSRGDARVDPRAQNVTPPPYIVKNAAGGILYVYIFYSFVFLP